MPIYLPPLSRRRFLWRAGAALAGLAAAPRLSARQEKTALTFALLADTHIAADSGRVERQVNMTDNLRRVIEEVRGRRDIRTVFVNGDCAFSLGEAEDYRSFRSLIHPVRAAGQSVYLTLGNHDHRENFWAGLGKKSRGRQILRDRQAGVVETDGILWILLDTLDKTNSTPGLLGAGQLHWLDRVLRSRRTRPVIVVGHHNLKLEGEKGALEDTEELLKILEGHRQVKAYIFGHTHHWEVKQTDGGLHLVNLPPVAYLFKAGEPNGWTEMSVTDAGAILQVHCLDQRHGQHLKPVEMRWRA